MNTFSPDMALANVVYLASLIPVSYLQSSLEIECHHLQFNVQFWTPTVNALKSTSDFILILMLLDRCRVMKFIIDMRIQKLRKIETYWIVHVQVLVLHYDIHVVTTTHMFV